MKPKCFGVGLLVVAMVMVSAANPLMAASGQAIRMAYLQSDIHHLALWVALEKGFFPKNNVTVEVAGIFKAGPEIMTAFAAGELDMAYVGEAPATTAVANKAARVVVVSQVNTEGSALVISRDNTGIKGLANLADKTVAVPGHSTVQDFLLRRALAKSGVALSAVNIMVVKPPEMIGALRTQQIDAFIAWEPYPSKTATMQVGRNLATSRQMWPAHPCCALVADQAYLAAHPEQVRSVVAAHVEATRFIHQSPGEALQIGVKYTGMDAETVQKAMQNVHYTTTLSIQGEKEYVQFLSKLGYIKVDDADAFVEEFIHRDILDEMKGQ